MAAALALAALAASSLAAGLGDPNTVMAYTGSTYFSLGGTNGTAGYTNAAVAVDTTKGKDLFIEFSFAGYNASLSNAVVLAVRRAGARSSSDTETTGSLARWAVTPNSTTAVVACTNLMLYAAPYVYITVENTNVCAMTNLTVKTYNK